MKYEFTTAHDATAHQLRRSRRSRRPIGMLGVSALACGSLVGAGVALVPQMEPQAPVIHAQEPALTNHSVASVIDNKAATARPVTSQQPAAHPDLVLLDPNYDLGGSRSGFGESGPLQAMFQPFVSQTLVAAAKDVPAVKPSATVHVASVEMPAAPEPAPLPVPMPRPPELAAPPRRDIFRPASRMASRQTQVASIKPVAQSAPGEKSGFFEKMFGGSEAAKGEALAYASPDDTSLRKSPMAGTIATSSDDRLTAIYDISAHTVYMPDGTRLEAHSGLGDKFDDPRHVDKKMRGPTPPGLYNLSPRESLFHGVRALRLTPANPHSMFGRDGILAHTYMLGQRGDSNGCVSFRNYDSFLQAYLRGDVKRLVVVARRD